MPKRIEVRAEAEKAPPAPAWIPAEFALLDSGEKAAAAPPEPGQPPRSEPAP